jgi:gliding motility-associated-like protein
VINDPNNSGAACNLVLKQQSLSGGTSQLGLPNICPGFYVNRAAEFDFQSVGGCNGLMQFTSVINAANVSFSWDFGDGQTSTLPNPVHQFANITQTYFVKLKVTDATGCINETVAKPLIPAGGSVKARFNTTSICDQLQASFVDSSESSSTALTYAWDFGDGNSSTEKSPLHVYSSAGAYTVKLVVTAGNGCMKDSSIGLVNLSAPVISAGPDIQVMSIGPVQLQATGGSRYHWEPSTYLSDADIPNPIMTARADIAYIITGFNDAGCSATANLKVTVLKNLLVEVPNAFSPASSKNNSLRPLLRLIDHINYFRVYNRWGQLLFETKEMGKGWDGKLNGQLQPTGSYMWMMEVVDFDGNVIQKKGTSVLIR